MTYTPADYVIVAAAVGSAVLGIFVGFSGALALLAGVVSAVLAARFGWPLSADFLSPGWLRTVATLVASLVAFGLVRLVVRRLVNGLLAQPADAIFGALSAAALGAVLALAAVWAADATGLVPAPSNLLSLVLPYVGI